MTHEVNKMDEKKKYIVPQMEITQLAAADIITQSGGSDDNWENLPEE